MSSEEFNRTWYEPFGSHMVYSNPTNPRVCVPCVSAYGEALAQYTFTVTDFSTGLPVKGAQCAILDRYAISLQQRFDGAGCITGADGMCSIPEQIFPVRYWSVYKAGYVTQRGSVTTFDIVVALVPTDLMYWVSVLAGANGSVKPSGTFQVEANTKLTVTAEPNEGYILDYWLINDKRSGSTNPLSVIIDKDSFSIYAVFKVEEVPPPPDDVPWPVSRQIHVFYNERLNPGWETWADETKHVKNIDTAVLLGGKLDCTISYETAKLAGVTAKIYWNEELLEAIPFSALEVGKVVVRSYDLTGKIESSNSIRIGLSQGPAGFNVVAYDIYATIGYSEEPVIEPSVPEPPWWKGITWWQWLLIGGVAFAGVMIVTREKPVIVVTPERE